MRRGVLWLFFLASSAVAIAWFFIPAIIIQPFKHQAPAALGWAMALRHRAPWGTLLAAVVSLILAAALWRDPLGYVSVGFRTKLIPWARRSAVVLIVIVVAFSTVMARINYFEWMFHPIDSPRFDAQAASKLDQNEMVLAVRHGSDARAYPINEMAYHHVLNDVVDGVPIAATY
jgi:hypothetical protein